MAGRPEPFYDVLGMTIGMIAVDVFFVTSRFLITASLLTRQKTVEFVWARVLRIFPALFIVLLDGFGAWSIFYDSAFVFLLHGHKRLQVFCEKPHTAF